MLWGARPPARWMGADRLPSLSPGTTQRSSAEHVPNPLSPCPPRRSGVARHHGHLGDTTRPRRLDAFGSSGRAPDRQAQSVTRGSSCKRTGSVVASPALEAKTVAELLRNPDTRNAALSALEAHTTPIDLAVSLAAGPVLNEIRTLETSREEWDRVCLLLARLVAEAGDEAPTVYGTAFAGGRSAAVLRSERTPAARVLRKPAAELTLEDARSVANAYACWPPACVNSFAKLFAAQGVSTLEGLAEGFRLDGLVSKCGLLLCCHLCHY